MRTTYKTEVGFTIVELLIVIVVIGILAAITVMSYSGVQQRAKNIQRIAAAKEWQKIITLYTSSNGVYPYGNGNHFCLGSGYETNWDANPDEDCGWSNNIKHTSSGIMNSFKTVAQSFPAFPIDRLNISSPLFSGGISARNVETLDPAGVAIASYPTILYWLDGNNQDCVLKPVIVYVSGGIALSTGSNFSLNDGPSTQCRIGLPDPTRL